MSTFEGVHVTTTDGRELCGVLDAEKTDETQIGVLVDPENSQPDCALTTLVQRCAVAHLSVFQLPVAPTSTFRKMYCKTGGVNSKGRGSMELDTEHLRHVIAGEPDDKLMEINIINPRLDDLQAFLRKYPELDCDVERPEECSGVLVYIVRVPGDIVAHAIFAATKEFGLLATSAARRKPSIMCDTLARSKHTYAQQTKTTPKHAIGPKRDLWRFCIVLPERWLGRLAPFTWEGYARGVFFDICDCVFPSTEALHASTSTHVAFSRFFGTYKSSDVASMISELPHPIRGYVVTEGRAVAHEAIEASDSLLRTLCDAVREQESRKERLCDDICGIDAAAMALDGRPSLQDTGAWTVGVTALLSERAELSDELSLTKKRHGRALNAERVHSAHLWMMREAAHALRTLDVPQETGRCVPLTEPQQSQLIHAFHCIKYGSAFFDARALGAARAALFHSALRSGIVVRHITVYESSSNYTGYGDTLRNPPANEDDMPAAARMRCKRDAEGKLVGMGSKGCKGTVYAPKEGQSIYTPLTQQTRSLVDTGHMQVKQMRVAES